MIEILHRYTRAVLYSSATAIGAALEGVEVSNGYTLQGCFGEGRTKQEAAQNYVDYLVTEGQRGGTLVVDAYKPERREFVWCAIRKTFVTPESSRITE